MATVRRFALMDEQALGLWGAYLVNGRPNALRDRLVEHYAPLCRTIAGRFCAARRCAAAPLGADDYEQDMLIRLAELIASFDPGRGLCFWQFAQPHLYHSMADTRRKWDFWPRHVRQAGRAGTVERLPDGWDLPAPIDRSAASFEDLDHAEAIFRRLPTERMRLYARLRFIEGLTLRRIGEQMGGRCESAMSLLHGQVAEALSQILHQPVPRRFIQRQREVA